MGMTAGGHTVPFNRPQVVGREMEYVAAAAAGTHWSGDGAFTARCARWLESEIGATRALLTTSCTHALEMAALLLALGPGDEVILPSFTFVSTVNAVVLRGATPVFVDIRQDTLNLDERLVAAAITDRTKAVFVVHYAGVACEMDDLVRLCDAAGVAIVEDNAHGLGGRYRGRPLGSFGKLATLSFHETKNFTCGEGGALVINDPTLVEPAEIVREKGTNRSRFFRGQVDKYTWVDLGSSYLPSELLAGFLFGQLEQAETIQRRRHAIWTAYNERLAGWAAALGVALPAVPDHCEHPSHLFYMRFRNGHLRDAFIAHLRRRGILAVFHYLPLHLSPFAGRWGYQAGALPVTERTSEQLVRLPLFTGMSDAELEAVIAAVREWDGTS